MADLASLILTAIASFFLIGAIVAIGVAFFLYRFLSSLNAFQRSIILAFLILIGFVLIVTVVGAPIGVVLVLSGVFTSLFTLVRRGDEED